MKLVLLSMQSLWGIYLKEESLDTIILMIRIIGNADRFISNDKQGKVPQRQYYPPCAGKGEKCFGVVTSVIVTKLACWRQQVVENPIWCKAVF